MASSTSNNFDLNAVLIENLMCPVCYNHALPPIYHCAAGHVVCTPCNEQVSSCPVCRGPKATIRCQGLEKMAEHLKFPCKFYDNGCTVTLSCNNKSLHELSCPYHTCTCPWPIASCNWEGPCTAVLDHLFDKGLKLTDSATVIFKATLLHDGHGSTWSVMQNCFGHNFITVVTLNNDGVFCILMRLIGTKENARKFKYTTCFENEKGLKRFEGVPFSVVESITDKIRNGFGIYLDMAAAEPYIENNEICFIVEIQNAERNNENQNASQ